MKSKHTVAILGFGVVGGGVADLIKNNARELESYLGHAIEIAHILDLRDFPDSPFGSLVTHDYNDILNDGDVDTVIEVMGGSHPAYEYTVSALCAGKNVITSNKEVVARYGDEFVRLARENGVSYRFEAAVGGGIPVIAPMLGSVRQNRIREVRGILNGTTNYILTKMFTYGDSFDCALRDAQDRGYAERNPDADILGTDACRKIAILTALATDMLPEVDDIPTEGITGIRAEDVRVAEELGHRIKLLGRCILGDDGRLTVCVAPFLLPAESPLAGVSGVYNAVEVIAEPLGNVMFYGQGAGAGATASAVVGDLIPIVAYGSANPITPGFNRIERTVTDSFDRFESKSYVALPQGNEDAVRRVFGKDTLFVGKDECAFITDKMTEAQLKSKISEVGAPVISRIRFL